MYCPYCGKQNEDTARFCQSCGAQLPIIEETTTVQKEELKQIPVVPSVPRKQNESRIGKVFLVLLLVLALIICAGMGLQYIRKSKTEKPEAVQVETHETTVEQPVVNKEGREVGAIIQPKEEIDAFVAKVDNHEMDYQETLSVIDHFAGAYNKFALDMVRSTIVKGENYISSPFSLYAALGLLSNAASGKTLEELQQALGLTNQEINEAICLFMQRNVGYEGDTAFSYGNSVWLNKDMNFEINDNYRDIVTSYYKSDVFQESFNDTQNTIDTMNAWVAEHTNNNIKDIFNPNNVSPATTFVLANALAFEDRWFDEFNPSENTEEAFYNYGGDVVKSTMLHSLEDGYWSDGNAEGISKRLIRGGEVVLILPNEGVDVYDYINSCSLDTFQNFSKNVVVTANMTSNSMDYHYTNLSVPKFKYDATLELNEAMKQMGIQDIFNADANLSKMLKNDYDQLFVDQIIQKATVDLNEKGISAAAATMIGGMGDAGGMTINYIYHDLVLDRPFIFAIVNDGFPSFIGDGVPSFIGVVSQMEGTPLSQADIKALAEANKDLGTITIKVDGLNMRSLPSTSGKRIGTAENGKTYQVYEKNSAEGYTWYRIGDNQWVADDGSWVTYNR